MPVRRPYHHGNLREALIEAAVGLIGETGPQGFSLAEAARRAGVALDETGYFFAASSESNAIDAQEYGTAFTDEAFVRARVHELAGEQAVARFEPLAFWNHQDAWVLRR